MAYRRSLRTLTKSLTRLPLALLGAVAFSAFGVGCVVETTDTGNATGSAAAAIERAPTVAVAPPAVAASGSVTLTPAGGVMVPASPVADDDVTPKPHPWGPIGDPQPGADNTNTGPHK
jgi:hypothetical protein